MFVGEILPWTVREVRAKIWGSKLEFTPRDGLAKVKLRIQEAATRVGKRYFYTYAA